VVCCADPHLRDLRVGRQRDRARVGARRDGPGCLGRQRSARADAELRDVLVEVVGYDAEKARAWYDSPEYRDVRKIRWASSTSNMVLVPGLDVAGLTAPAVAEE
jgi:hypothetical protein